MSNNMNTTVPDFIPVLSRGAHYDPKEGACVMEMVSFLAGEEWSDTPACSYNSISFLAQLVNDNVSDDNRGKIANMIHRLIGTSGLSKCITKFDVAAHEAVIARFDSEYSIKNSTMWYVWYKGTPGDVVKIILNHFKNAPESERKTNEEYDDDMIEVLTIVLDVADEILGRNPQPIDLTPLKELACQNA
jgi:hypothetical protein